MSVVDKRQELNKAAVKIEKAMKAAKRSGKGVNQEKACPHATPKHFTRALVGRCMLKGAARLGQGF